MSNEAKKKKIRAINKMVQKWDSSPDVLPPWQTFEEYEALNKAGPCWIFYNDRVLEAFRYRQTGYWIMSPAGWQERVADEEHITNCMDRVAPQPPEGV